MLYAWFALMGGFSIDTSKLHNSLPVATLGLDGILFLARRGHFFRLPDAQISDKSKADYLAKGIVVVQVLWFVCAGLTRKFAGLPIRLLEYHAFVNIGCAIATYILWFKKPLAIKTPTIESPANKEQLIAAMLFMAELEEKPKFVLEEALSPRRAPAEKWLWSWVPNKPSLTINAHIPEHIFERIPEVTVQIKPANHEEGVKTERGRDIVSHLEEPSCFLECGCPWSDRDGLHRCNTTRPGWNVHLSKKDQRRLDLVRQYIETQHGIRPRVTIITSESSPVRNEPQLPPFISANRHQQVQPTPRRPTSHISIPLSSSYAASSDLEMQNIKSERGRPTTLPPNFRTQEYLDSLRDSRQGMPVHRIWCLQEIPINSIYTILPNFDTSDVLDYGFTRLSKWRWWLAVTALLIVPSGYGAAHLYPVLTHYSFPTGCERQLWWISCIFIMTILAGPLAFAALKSLLSWVSRATSSDPITRRGRRIEQRKQRVLKRLLLGLAIVYFAFWLTARLYLIVESFASLRRVRAEIFETPQWNLLNYIPHI